jgi:hypothetical protein
MSKGMTPKHEHSDGSMTMTHLTDQQRDDMYAEYLSMRVEELNHDIRCNPKYASEVALADKMGLTCAEVVYVKHGIQGFLKAADNWGAILLQDMFPALRDEIEDIVVGS